MALMVFVCIVMIAAIGIFAKWTLQQTERQLSNQTAVNATLKKIDIALANFVAQNKRLPCPADGSIASGLPNAGIESPYPAAALCAPATQAKGVVPWVTLGISESEATDPWNGRITYRVQAALANSVTKLMNMSWCDPAGTTTGASGLALACTAACSGTACMHPLNFLYSKGLQVQDGLGGWLNQPAPPWAAVPPPPNSSGAAYVLISHGPTGAGAYNKSGNIQPGSAVVGTNEMANRNNQALTGATIFIDAKPDNTLTASHFDDYLSHPTISTVLTNASLGPRSPH
ncbi:hypothetical protein ACO0K9_16345 [Undibacterium sp. Ji50W]|uniref:hypothetical protein n=1 Tax=Undibacterium sp. Ji50W TaxID=3413041 RepID=UPI003BF143AB